MVNRTTSEQLFEDYLLPQGIPFEYEPAIPESTQRPDYRLTLDQSVALVEVKEFVGKGTPPIGSFGAYDPYPPIREKINAGSRKFKALKRYPCALLLCNVSGFLIRTDVPEIVMGAMLGDLGFQFRIDTKRGAAIEDPQPKFLGGGKMINHARNQPQNTTISAVLVLEPYQLGVKRFVLEEHRACVQMGRPLNDEELEELYSRAAETVPRIKLHQNPYARTPFPNALFRGPFDEHWTWGAGGCLERSFVGPRLLELEEARRAIDARAR